MEVNVNLIPCAHCEKTGTCRSGTNGASCSVCIKHHDLTGMGHMGIPCGTCSGLGLAETVTDRINKRYKAVLSVYAVTTILSLALVSLFWNSAHFTEILYFLGPVLAGILGINILFHKKIKRQEPTL